MMSAERILERVISGEIEGANPEPNAIDGRGVRDVDREPV
jgi:hypothetical protein